MNIKLNKEEAQTLIDLLESISVQGTEGMKKIISLSEKLKKAIEGKDKQVK